jgi:hypothetical protein
LTKSYSVATAKLAEIIQTALMLVKGGVVKGFWSGRRGQSEVAEAESAVTLTNGMRWRIAHHSLMLAILYL